MCVNIRQLYYWKDSIRGPSEFLPKSFDATHVFAPLKYHIVGYMSVLLGGVESLLEEPECYLRWSGDHRG